MDSATPRSSAVLLLLFDRQGQTFIILTKRTQEVANHKGQISLPGGAAEPGDPTLLATALREAREELGIETDNLEVLGRLADVYTPVSNFIITPFVARLSAPPSLRPDPTEVAQVIEVPLDALADLSAWWEEERDDPIGGRRTVYFFRHGTHIVWGATARILRQFMENRESLEKLRSEEDQK